MPPEAFKSTSRHNPALNPVSPQPNPNPARPPPAHQPQTSQSSAFVPPDSKELYTGSTPHQLPQLNPANRPVSSLPAAPPQPLPPHAGSLQYQPERPQRHVQEPTPQYPVYVPPMGSLTPIPPPRPSGPISHHLNQPQTNMPQAPQQQPWYWYRQPPSWPEGPRPPPAPRLFVESPSIVEREVLEHNDRRIKLATRATVRELLMAPMDDLD